MKKNKIFLFIISVLINLSIFIFTNLQITFSDVITIHFFLFVLTLSTDLIQSKLAKRKAASPSLFLSLNFARIFSSILFLLPHILNYENSDNSYIYSFFLSYFLILFGGVFFVHRESGKINR